MTAGDAFNLACGGPDPTNCPDAKGPDVDFGSPPILVTLASGKRALVIGQKSAVVHALDPDDKGKVLWSTRIGRGGALGGVEWGSAADTERIYVPLSDIAFRQRGLDIAGMTPNPDVGGGLFAFGVEGKDKERLIDLSTRKQEGDGRAAASRAADLDRPAVQLDISLRNRQPESGAGRLRREVGLEDLRRRLGIHSHARIRYLHDHGAP